MKSTTTVKASGVDIVVAFDLSGSMMFGGFRGGWQAREPVQHGAFDFEGLY